MGVPDEQQGVAVRRGARHFGRADAAPGAAAVVHDDLLPQQLAELRSERARDEVLLALRIAGSKVRTAQEQVHEIGTH